MGRSCLTGPRPRVSRTGRMHAMINVMVTVPYRKSISRNA